MNYARIFSGALCAILATAAAPTPTVSSDSALVGWAAGPAVATEFSYERQLMAVPSAANAMDIERHISSLPHRAGSAADYATALYVQKRLAGDGFATRIQKYQVEFTGPLEQSLSLVSPQKRDFSLLEGTPGHPNHWEQLAGQPFLEESGDGTVTGPVVYVNAASKDDFAELDAQHVHLKGAIVIVRLSAPGGGGIRALDPHYNAYNELHKRGAVAILEFMDPATQGYGGGVMWPAGNFKNANMAERMSGLSPRSFMQFPPGDPTMDGHAPVMGAAHKSWNQIPHSTMPELSITQSTARALLVGMTGKAVPQSWHPMFAFVQRFGGNQIVRVHTKFERELKTIWLVFGDMKGSTNPDSIVMIGSHRDAMTFGAIDPGSGTTVLLQDADAFAKLAKAGWKPKRTIEFASWDGHELGLFGSAAWIYQNGPGLRTKDLSIYQHRSVDHRRSVRGECLARALCLHATDLRRRAAGQQLADARQARSAHVAAAQPDGRRIRPSELCLHAWRSEHLERVLRQLRRASHRRRQPRRAAHLRSRDARSVVTAQVTGIQAMRAASADVSPLRIEEIPTELLKDLMPIQLAAFEATDGKVTLSELRDALVAYQTAAHATDVAMQKAEAAGDTATMTQLAAKEQASRDAFYMPDGLLQQSAYHTIDRVFTSFPEIVFAGKGKEMKAKAVDRMTAAVKNATAALQ